MGSCPERSKRGVFRSLSQKRRGEWISDPTGLEMSFESGIQCRSDLFPFPGSCFGRESPWWGSSFGRTHLVRSSSCRSRFERSPRRILSNGSCRRMARCPPLCPSAPSFARRHSRIFPLCERSRRSRFPGSSSRSRRPRGASRRKFPQWMSTETGSSVPARWAQGYGEAWEPIYGPGGDGPRPPWGRAPEREGRKEESSSDLEPGPCSVFFLPI